MVGETRRWIIYAESSSKNLLSSCIRVSHLLVFSEFCFGGTDPITFPNHRPLVLLVKMRIGTDLVMVGDRDLWQKWFWVSVGFCLFVYFCFTYTFCRWFFLLLHEWEKIGEKWMNKFLIGALEEFDNTEIWLYIFPTFFKVISAKFQENSCSMDRMEASILKWLLLDLKDISGSLLFVGLIYCIELCGLETFIPYWLKWHFFPSHTTYKKRITRLLLGYMS